MKRILSIIALAMILAHATISLCIGSADPTTWSPLTKAGCIFIVAPLLALAMAILDGFFDRPAPTFGPRARARRER